MRGGVPEVLDAFRLIGSGEDEPFGGYSYVASDRDLTPLAEQIHDAFARERGPLASASVPAPGICAIRILTDDATALYALLNRSRAFLALPSPARAIS